MMLAKALEGIKAKQITRPGELVGNIAYMAPERTKSDVEVDTRADLYGLGATMYALLTGKPPFEGKSLVETIAQIRQSDPVPPKKFQLSIPDKLQDVVMMLLAKRPEMRYQTPAQAARRSSKWPSFREFRFRIFRSARPRWRPGRRLAGASGRCRAAPRASAVDRKSRSLHSCRHRSSMEF